MNVVVYKTVIIFGVRKIRIIFKQKISVFSNPEPSP